MPPNKAELRVRTRSISLRDRQRLKRIIEGLRGREFNKAIADKDLWDAIREEASSDDPDKLVTQGTVRVLEGARARQKAGRSLSLFFSTDDVIIVPGFMGSELVDLSEEDGLAWVDPRLVMGKPEDVGKLNRLELGHYTPGKPEADAAAGAVIRPNGAVPLIYDALKYELEVRRYSVRVFGVDWRKDAEEPARSLAELIRARADQRLRPLHLIAHSQGSLIARRALQLLGRELARQLVANLVLIGPTTAGSFLAITALAGSHEFLEVMRRHRVDPPSGFEKTLRTMSSLYQLIPWRTKPVGQPPPDPAVAAETARPLEWIAENLGRMTGPNTGSDFWPRGVDKQRLGAFLGRGEKIDPWGKKVDTSFFNDRTSIILGHKPTVGGLRRREGSLVADPKFETMGDGNVPDALALIDGVTRVYKAADADHMTLPGTLSVIAAVRDILAGRPPRVELGARRDTPFPFLVEPKEWPETGRGGPEADNDVVASAYSAGSAGGVRASRMAGDVSPPACRRLRVFSFDPLMATELDSLGTDQLTLELPWDFGDGDQLQPGPVGEYIEVVDVDPASRCVYSPIDLNHPHALAQDGLPVSEGDPRFHQQMVYAVAMNTIRQFEVALGRKALWGPHLERDASGRVKERPGLTRQQHAELEFVQRLRIYPHAMREPNAFYDPDKKALLFGYFPAEGQEGDRDLPGGTVFTCLSHDVIAHETTHALLDGMHRYFTEPSNPDVFAFHEAFADIVALFQHFSHRDVLWHELARARGDITHQSKLGVLAAQFGEATGHHGALRQYLGRKDEKTGKWAPIEPDPSAIREETEAHGRGALLVAALFRSFTNIYENRVRDLRKIATGGSGELPDGDLYPDLVTRMADEAAKAARHMLTMCIRALDYVPPIDVTFGEYLRALVTADYDLVRDDDRHYRVSVLSAFRDWGIYPPDVRSLSIDNLLWSGPSIDAHLDLRDFFGDAWDPGWDLSLDRRSIYVNMMNNKMRFHEWLARSPAEQVENLGLAFGPEAPRASSAQPAASPGGRTSRSTRSAPAAGSARTASS